MNDEIHPDLESEEKLDWESKIELESNNQELAPIKFLEEESHGDVIVGELVVGEEVKEEQESSHYDVNIENWSVCTTDLESDHLEKVADPMDYPVNINPEDKFRMRKLRKENLRTKIWEWLMN